MGCMMKTIMDEFDNYLRLTEMLAAQFGSNCEIVLHDLSQDYSSTIVAIQNGHVTSRKVGECGSNLGLEVLRGVVKNGDKYKYFTRLKDGKIVRSSTTYLKDDAGQVIGALCINYDITNMMQLHEMLKNITMVDDDFSEGTVEEEVFASNVGELLDHFIIEHQKKLNKNSLTLTKEEKIKAIQFFDNKGAFLITKAGDRICEYLGISKYTLYNYLDIARNQEKSEEAQTNYVT